MTLSQRTKDFMQKSGLTGYALGTLALEDGRFINELQRGECGIGKVRAARLEAWLRENDTPDRIAHFKASSDSRQVSKASHAPYCSDPENWTVRAKKSSAALVAAIRQHHPERCPA